MSDEISNISPNLPDGDKPHEWADRSSDEHYTRHRSIWPQVGSIWLTHFVLAFATGFILNFFGMFLNDTLAEAVTYTVCIILFCLMLYVDGWHNGQQNYNLYKFGHMKDDKFRGLKAALLSQTIGLVLAVLAIIHLYMLRSEAAQGIPEDMQTGLFWGFLSVYHLFYFPFVGIVWPLEEVSPLFCLLPLIIPPVVYHIGYTLGYKRISIREKIMYKHPEKTSGGGNNNNNNKNTGLLK